MWSGNGDCESGVSVVDYSSYSSVSSGACESVVGTVYASDVFYEVSGTVVSYYSYVCWTVG